MSPPRVHPVALVTVVLVLLLLIGVANAHNFDAVWTSSQDIGIIHIDNTEHPFTAVAGHFADGVIRQAVSNRLCLIPVS